MTIKLTCHVCQQPHIEDNTCPNCETDLTLVRMLMELPSIPIPQNEPTPLRSPDRRYRNQAFLLVLMGLLLGILSSAAIGAYFSSQSQISTPPTSAVTTLIDPSPVSSVAQSQPKQSSEIVPNKSSTCNGFHYLVRSGDSLTGIAWNLYGDADRSVEIVNANPTISDRVNHLEIGEILLIPDREAVCP